MKIGHKRHAGSYGTAVHPHANPQDARSPIGVPAGPHRRGGKMGAHAPGKKGANYRGRRRRHG